MILQSIIATKLPQNAMEQIFNKFENIDILLLKCGQNNIKLHSYLHKSLTTYLRKMQALNMQRAEYIELVSAKIQQDLKTYILTRKLSLNSFSSTSWMFGVVSLSLLMLF